MSGGRKLLAVLTIVFTVGIGILALGFNDTSYIVILAPLAWIEAILLVAALVVMRRWWLLLLSPFLAIPHIPWSTR